MYKKNKNTKYNLQKSYFSRAIIKTKKVNLYIFFIGLIFNAIFAMIANNLAISKNDGVMLLTCTVMEIIVTVVLIYGIIKYYRRKIILTNEGVEYIPTFGKMRKYLYIEIGFVQLNKLNDENYTIFSKEGKKIASFNNGYEGIEESIVAFKGNGVEIKDKENGKIDNLILNTRNKLEKNREDEVKQIKRKDRLEQIKKEKNIIKKINIAIWVISIAVFFLGTRIRSIVWSLEVVFVWGVYIYLYPKMVVEIPKNTKGSKSYHYEIPFSVSLVLLLLIFERPKIEYTNSKIYIFVAIYLLIMISIYLFMLKKRNIKEKKGKMFTVIFAMMTIIFCTTNHINNALTFSPKNHEYVIVTSKDTSKSAKGNRYYYATALIDGEKKEIEINSAIYNELEKFPTTMVKCNRKSIFGCEYYKLHL